MPRVCYTRWIHKFSSLVFYAIFSCYSLALPSTPCRAFISPSPSVFWTQAVASCICRHVICSVLLPIPLFSLTLLIYIMHVSLPLSLLPQILHLLSIKFLLHIVLRLVCFPFSWCFFFLLENLLLFLRFKNWSVTYLELCGANSLMLLPYTLLTFTAFRRLLFLLRFPFIISIAICYFKFSKHFTCKESK